MALNRPDAGDAAARRVRAAPRAALVLLAATLAAGACVALGDRFSRRWDLTVTREHSLSPRTLGVLDRAAAPCDLVVIAESSRVPRAARRAVADLMDAYREASPRVGTAWIDPGAAGGPTAYADLVRRLLESRAADIESQRSAVEAALAAADQSAAAAGALALRMTEASAGAPGEPGPQAAAMRVRAGELARQTDAARAARSARVAGADLPDAGPLRAIAPALRTVAAEAQAAAQQQGAPPDLARAAALARDAALAAAEAIDRLPGLDVLGALRLAEAGPVALAVGPTRVVAIDFETLFRADEQTPGQAARTRFAGEEMLTAAIASLADVRRPLVVFTHAASAPLLTPGGAPASTDADALLGRTLERLRTRGITAAEWPVALRPEPPAPPSRDAPIVWVTIPTSPTAPNAAETAKALGAAVHRLLRDGASCLITIEPSTLPRVREPDPATAPLAALGVEADSGRPLVRRVQTARGPAVWPEFRVTDPLPSAPDAHPIARAVDGLALALPWPTPLTITPAPGVVAAPLIVMPASDDTWGEARWLSLRATPRAQRGSMPDPPAPDPVRDNLAGPWTIAAAVERPAPERDGAPAAPGSPPQRVVIVGASAWHLDPTSAESQTVNGRPALVNPGNAELFDASLAWLAGQDDLIAPGARSLETPRVGDLAPGALTALRWGVILVPPAAVLALGLCLRTLRR